MVDPYKFALWDSFWIILGSILAGSWDMCDTFLGTFGEHLCIGNRKEKQRNTEEKTKKKQWSTKENAQGNQRTPKPKGKPKEHQRPTKSQGQLQEHLLEIRARGASTCFLLLCFPKHGLGPANPSNLNTANPLTFTLVNPSTLHPANTRLTH